MKRRAKTLLVVHRVVQKARRRKYGHLHVNSLGMGVYVLLLSFCVT